MRPENIYGEFAIKGLWSHVREQPTTYARWTQARTFLSSCLLAGGHRAPEPSPCRSGGRCTTRRTLACLPGHRASYPSQQPSAFQLSKKTHCLRRGLSPSRWASLKFRGRGDSHWHIEASTATRPHGHVSERGCGTPGVE